MMGIKKKKLPEDLGNINRRNILTEGHDAHVLPTSVTAGGFIPHHKEPSNYIEVRSRNKKQKIFEHLFLAQELCTGNCTKKEKRIGFATPEKNSDNSLKSSSAQKSSGAIWAMEFSPDGGFLAAAGCEQTVNVWAVLSSPEERIAKKCDQDISSESGEERLNAPVFKSETIRKYTGHTGDVLDINWSKNNFILSSSLDRTVKLWHPSRPECLCTFSNDELVTSISFHPTDDRFFLAGSLDCTLRLWSIPEKKVAFSCVSPDPITAVAFTPNGMIAISGGFSGLCRFYDVDPNSGLKLSNEIHVRSSRGKNAKGSKITGIRTAIFPSKNNVSDDVDILITSNDSRIRLYNLKNRQLEMKFQGHENNHSQIYARFSDDGRYVICGSEDHKTYIWSIKPKNSDQKEVPPAEVFNAHSSIVTAAILAPVTTRKLISNSGDPIYDICNPPPVTLLSLDEHIAGMQAINDTSNPVMIPKKTEVSPAYLARTSHDEGLIILTSDIEGSIKCFRIDCAFEKRHQWETSSTFSKKQASISRSNSSKTMTSISSRSNSLNRSSTSISTHSERYGIKWRGKLTNGFIHTSQRDLNKTPEKSHVLSNRISSMSMEEKKLDSLIEAGTDLSPLKAASNSKNRLPDRILHTSPSLPTPGFSLTDNLESDKSLKNPNQTAKLSSFWNINNWRTSRGSGGGHSGEKSIPDVENANDKDDIPI